MSGQHPNIFKKLPLYNGRFDAHQLKAENCNILFASYQLEMFISPHTHDTENHGIITRGEMILTMNGQVQKFSVGQWYYIPVHIEHSAYFEVETDVIEFWFQTEAASNAT